MAINSKMYDEVWIASYEIAIIIQIVRISTDMIEYDRI